MPIFLVISGILSKPQGISFAFINKKIKRLIIPFVLIYSIFSVIIPSLYIISDTPCPLIINNGITIRRLLGDFIFNDCQIINGPLWFLLSLFEIQILFALFSMSANKSYMYLFSFLCGVIGLSLSYYSINLYASIDNALTCLPYYALGYYMKNDSNLITAINNPNSRKGIYFLLSAFICFFTKSHIEYHRNIIYDYSFFTAHICGITGTLMLILLAYALKKMSFINYLGRNSIIILCSHFIIIKLSADLFHIGCPATYFSSLFIVVICSQLAIIPFCKKYMSAFF